MHSAVVHGVDAWIAGLAGAVGVVVVDDLGVLAEEPASGHLNTTDRSASVALLAAGTPGCLPTHYQGPVAALRRSTAACCCVPVPAMPT